VCRYSSLLSTIEDSLSWYVSINLDIDAQTFFPNLLHLQKFTIRLRFLEDRRM